MNKCLPSSLSLPTTYRATEQPPPPFPGKRDLDSNEKKVEKEVGAPFSRRQKYGNIIAMIGQYYGKVTATLQQRHINVMATFTATLRQYYVNVTAMIRQYYGNVTATLRQRHISVMATLRQYYVNDTAMIRQHYGNITATLRQHYSNITATLWQHYGDDTATLRFHYGNITTSLFYLVLKSVESLQHVARSLLAVCLTVLALLVLSPGIKKQLFFLRVSFSYFIVTKNHRYIGSRVVTGSE